MYLYTFDHDGHQVYSRDEPTPKDLNAVLQGTLHIVEFKIIGGYLTPRELTGFGNETRPIPEAKLFQGYHVDPEDVVLDEETKAE